MKQFDCDNKAFWNFNVQPVGMNKYMSVKVLSSPAKKNECDFSHLHRQSSELFNKKYGEKWGIYVPLSRHDFIDIVSLQL